MNWRLGRQPEGSHSPCLSVWLTGSTYPAYMYIHTLYILINDFIAVGCDSKFPKTMENYVNCFGTKHAQKLTPYWITSVCERERWREEGPLSGQGSHLCCSWSCSACQHVKEISFVIVKCLLHVRVGNAPSLMTEPGKATLAPPSSLSLLLWTKPELRSCSVLARCLTLAAPADPVAKVEARAACANVALWFPFDCLHIHANHRVGRGCAQGEVPRPGWVICSMNTLRFAQISAESAWEVPSYRL